MQIYAECGQRSAALRQYEECRRVLDEELGVAPDHETTELANSIRQRRFPPSDSGGQPSLNQERPSGGKPEVLDSSPRSDKEGTAVVQNEIRVVTVLAAGLCQTSETDWELPPDQSATLIGQMVEVVGQIVADFGGDVAHLLVDGALAIFGATVIHEDDVERAARAALSIRNAAAGLALDVAIGIATGTAYVSPVAGGNEASAVGAVVNLATRLQARAAAGQILIAETTYHQTRGLLRTTPMAMQLRGRAEPITVYHVERARRSAAKARGIEGVQTELIGRDAELARLSALLQESHRGCGQMVALIGDAGIGKSRLIADLKRTANPTLWLEGRCLEMSSDTPYAPFIDLLRSYLDWPVGSSEAQRATGIVSALDRLVDEGNLSEEERETMGPLLGNLLAVRYNTDWDSRLSPAGPEQIRFQTLQAVHDLLLAIARSQPLTLVLEDLHWADDLTIDLITALMDDLAESPLMLLCVYRPQRQHRCWQLAAVASHKCLDRFTEIRLHELTTEQGNRMVLSLAGDRPFSADTQAMVLARAQGNPFFIEEIVHSLIGGAAPAEKAIPESVQAVILSRVDRLHPEAKLFLQAAATLGRTFVQRIVAAMAPEISDMEETLAELQEHAILYQERVLPEVAYSFRHVLVQEAVYATLPGQRRRDLHGQAGRAIEDAYSESLPEQVERLAYHFDRSDDDGKAVEYLLLAGERARTAYLNQVAISYFERILDRLDGATPKPKSDEQEFQALIGLGKLYATISKYEEADDCLRHALKLGREMALPASRLAPIYHWLGDLLINWDGHMQEALALCLEGLELVGDAKTVESAMIEGILGFVYEMTGEATKHAEIARRLETYVLELPYQAELSTAFGVVGIYYFNGKNMAEAMHWREEVTEAILGSPRLAPGR